MGQGSDPEPIAGARPGNLRGERSESCLGGRLERLAPRESGWRRAGERSRQGAWLRGWEEQAGERRNPVLDMVSMGCPEGVWWDVGMGQG